MQYIELYEDDACTKKFGAFPCIEINPTSAPEPHTVTIGDNVYSCFGQTGAVVDVFNGERPNARPVFSSTSARFPNGKTFYTKNSFRFTIQETNVLYDFCGTSDIKYGTSDADVFQGGQARIEEVGESLGNFFVRYAVNGVVYLGLSGWWKLGSNTFVPVFLIEEKFWTENLRPPYDYGNSPDGTPGQGDGKIDGTGVHTSPTPSGHVPTGGRGLHIYRISPQGYNSLQNYLWGEGSTLAKTLWQKFMNHNHNPANCICGCFQLPSMFMPPRGNASGVQLGGVNLPTNGTYTTTHLYIDTPTYSLGTIVPPFGSWLDYAGVSCKISVPFCGEIPVPVEKVWNQEVTVQYRCDTFNGNFGAVVKAGDNMIANITGNVAYQIPIVAGDDGTLQRIGAAAAGVLGIVTAGSSGAAMSAAGSTLAGIAGAQYNTFCTNGNTSGNAQSCINGVAYIEYIVPQTGKIDSATYNGSYGMPSCISGTLSEFSGGYGEFDVSLQEVANVWNATQEEKEEIVRLLEGGVYVCSV